MEGEGDARPSIAPTHAYVFPPALVATLRPRLAASTVSFADVGDEVMAELLTAVFFASLETHESEHYPVRVAFAGRITADVISPEGDAQDATPMLFYRWSTLRLEPPRPFSVRELVRLGIVTRTERMYLKVELHERGLFITGLAREGQNREGDPYLKVLAQRPGVLSVRRGDDTLLEYVRGEVAAIAEDVMACPGVVQRALGACARRARLGDAVFPDYLAMVREIVAEMSGHGHGGILVVSPEERPQLPVGAAYSTEDTSTLGRLLVHLERSSGTRRAKTDVDSSPHAVATHQLRELLESAFSNETERMVAELGSFTAMDGATVLDCSLGLRGFGVVLPVARDIEVLEALDPEAAGVVEYDLSTRGTRHRAAATYTAKFPGSVVFVASNDGPLSCLVWSEPRRAVLLWRVRAPDTD